MNCSEVQQVLPELIEGSENIEYQAHLKSCPDCSELVSDLALIASESRQLAECDEPPQRVWVSIAAELRSEGIIREPETAPARPVPVPGRRWNSWWLVPVAAALVAAGSYVIKPKTPVPVATQNPPAVAAPVQNTPSQPTVATVKADKTNPAPQKAIEAAKQDSAPNHAPLMTVGTGDAQSLDGVAPEMRSEYESQLREVDAYIRDASAYLKQYPNDEDARQHLMSAYEQKAMLFQMALDHVQ
jgi:hypothetical protein